MIMKTTMKRISRFIALFLLTILLIGTTLNAQDFTKVYQKKFDVDQGALLVIKNKFGEVKCLNWNENAISINVTITAETSSQDKANRIFDKIGVELSGDRTKVQGITTVGSISNAEFSIDYEISMPAWIKLDLTNQFGDIYLPETGGDAKIKLEYGAMEAEAFNGQANDLQIKFSDVSAGSIKNGILDIEYSDWESEEAETLKVRTRFSEVAIEKVDNLNLDSQYDEINVEEAAEVVVISRFSDMDFGKISGNFDFDIEYGDLDIDIIAPSFKNGKVRNTFAGASMTFATGASIMIDAELEFGDLSYPKATSMNHQTVGYTTNIYKGKLGASSATPSQLRIISKNSDVTIDFED